MPQSRNRLNIVLVFWQNARDKKRVKMEEMEVTIQQLEKQNQALVKKNENLAAENRLLVIMYFVFVAVVVLLKSLHCDQFEF